MITKDSEYLSRLSLSTKAQLYKDNVDLGLNAFWEENRVMWSALAQTIKDSVSQEDMTEFEMLTYVYEN